jgi:AraC-like DNA-binding protein
MTPKINIDRDFLFTDDIHEAMSDRYLDACLHLVVLSGRLKFQINETVFVAGANDCIIKPSSSPISILELSDDFRMTGVVISNEFLRMAVPNSDYTTKGMLATTSNPVMPMSSEETQLIIADIQGIKYRLFKQYHIYYADVVVHAVQLMILDMHDIHAKQNEENTDGLSQSTKILRRFVAYLQTGMYRQQRQVDYYASLLCITPKYLSECCIKASGHNASYYIDQFTGEEIARLLKDEDLSIAEVSDKLNFNTTSYFTRYAKRVLGMTPSEYKEKYSVKSDIRK